MNKTIYRKLQENSKTYRIQANIVKISLSLVILEETKDEINAYNTSLILEQNLKNQADQLGISLNKYYDKLIFFLENPEKVKFKFTEKSLLILESVNQNLRAKYFHCDIYKVENFSSFIGIYVDKIQEQISKSQDNHWELLEKYSLLEKEVQGYKTKLTELVQRKNLDEQIMLSNFASLLNEKKRRIQHLNELLEAFKLNPSLANPLEVNISYQKKRKRLNIKTEEPSTSRLKEEVSDSSSSSNSEHYTTDGEKTEETIEVKSDGIVADECFDDIFDESPKPLPTLPNISKAHTDSKTVTIMPVDFSIKNEAIEESNAAINSDEIELQESKYFNSPVVDINTQDWLNRL